jgi:hypothetical protein
VPPLGHVLAASLLAVPLLGAYLVSVLSSPIFVVRYLLGALPGLVLLVAGGLGRLRWVGAIGAVVLVLVSASLIHVRAPVEEWRAVTNDVLASSRPGDGIAFFHPAGHCVFDYYAGGRGPTVVFPRLTPGQTLFDEHASILVPLEAAEARAAVAGHKRIWVVSPTPGPRCSSAMSSGPSWTAEACAIGPSGTTEASCCCCSPVLTRCRRSANSTTSRARPNAPKPSPTGQRCLMRY